MSWFTRRAVRPSRPVPSFRSRLRLEELSLRAAPSSLDDPSDPSTDDTTTLSSDPTTDPTDPTDSGDTGTGDTGTGTGGTGDTGLNIPPPPPPSQPPPDNPPAIPDIDQFDAIEISHGLYEIIGHVSAQQPSGLVVQFAGIPALNGQTATTDQYGNFNLVFDVATDGSDKGTITAQTKDANGNLSNERAGVRRSDVSNRPNRNAFQPRSSPCSNRMAGGTRHHASKHLN